MSEQRFCLRWNHHQTTLINVFDSLLKDESLVDVTLYAEGLPVKAHKVVLSACSQYFKTIFSAHNDTHPVIIINNVLHSELRALVDYMYRGEVNVCQDQLSSLIKAAESLKIKGLADGGERRPPAQPASAPPSPVPFQPAPRRSSSPHAVRDARPEQLNGRASPPPAKRPRSSSVEAAPPPLPPPPPAAVSAPPCEADGRAGSAERAELACSPGVGVGAGGGLPRIPATITPLPAGRRPEQPPSPPAAAPQPAAAEPRDPAAAVKQETPPGRGSDDGADSDAETDGYEGEPGPSGPPPLPPAPHPAAAPGFLNWSLGGADGGDGPFGAATEAGTPQGPTCPSLDVREFLARQPGAAAAAAAVRGWREHVAGLLPPPLPPPPAAAPVSVSCERCGRAYATTSSLNRHRRYECGQPPQFACPVCLMPFKHKHNMRTHVRVHHNS